MSKFLLLFGLIPLVALAGEDAVGWKLVWSDDFESGEAPNPSKWSYEVGRVRNDEKQFYTRDRRENARVEGGRLILEARREKHQGAEFTSASLITRGHAQWQYGRIEVKAKLPSARGTWPAIWMLPSDFGQVPWPKCGEIDIMEHVGYDPGIIHGTLHSEVFNHLKGTQRSSTQRLATFSSNFHCYAIEWSKDRIVSQIDGKTYATFIRKPTDGPAEWPFDKPFYLILNLAVGGSWGGQKGIDESAFPQRLEIEEVKVFQAKPN
jgi:beta-glucanase (GH16 family)